MITDLATEIKKELGRRLPHMMLKLSVENSAEMTNFVYM